MSETATQGEKRRVAVTGAGVVSGFGIGAQVFVDSIFAGKSAVTRVRSWDASALSCQIGAEVPAFDAGEYFNEPRGARRFEESIINAVVAARLALRDAQLTITPDIADATGCYIGSGIGGLNTLQEQIARAEDKGYDRLSPFFIVNSISNMPAGVVCIETGARGPSYSVVSACASSGHCLGEAMREIQSGRSQVMLAGGTEAALNAAGLGGFCSMKAVTNDFNDEPERGSRPFDAKRSGFVMGEGSAVLVLEDWDYASARGARLLGELVGYGASSDAFHYTAPPDDHEGAQRAMRLALKDAGLEPAQIGYINAHGTSTPINDRSETRAIRAVFGEHAGELLVSSTKSMHGHLLGAAAAIESVACVHAFLRGMAPPTINQDEQDPDCDLNYVPNAALPFEGEYAMCNTFGFGGQNAVLIFRKAVQS